MLFRHGYRSMMVSRYKYLPRRVAVPLWWHPLPRSIGYWHPWSWPRSTPCERSQMRNSSNTSNRSSLSWPNSSAVSAHRLRFRWHCLTYSPPVSDPCYKAHTCYRICIRGLDGDLSRAVSSSMSTSADRGLMADIHIIQGDWRSTGLGPYEQSARLCACYKLFST